MARVQLVHVAHTRSGDKGDTANVGVIAYDSEHYDLLCSQLTADRVKAHFGSMVRGDAERFELPNLGRSTSFCTVLWEVAAPCRS